MDPDREPIELDSPARGSQASPGTPGADGTSSAQRSDASAPRSLDPASLLPSSGAAPLALDADAAIDPAETLSPAVRRLVRQYDLDITGIHGTGPAGKIRVGDVIGMLGGRADGPSRAEPGGEPAEAERATGASRDAGVGRDAAPPRDDRRAPDGDAADRAETDAAARQPVSPRAVPTTTVFECDLSRVLSHRKRERRNETEIALTSYFLAASAGALRVVPEIAVPQHAGAPRLGVLLASADGSVRRTLVVAAEELDDGLRLLDGQLRASADDDLAGAQLLVHHYGPSGSMLATPTELGAAHAASLGIGRVRREIVVKTVDGEEAPRIAARCYVSLTFRPEQIALARANQFVATVVNVLEQWPVEPTSV